MPTHDTAFVIEVKLDGSTDVSGDSGSVSFKDGAHVSRVQVDQRLDAPDYFAITVQMMSQEQFIVLDAVKPGQEVEILLGHGQGNAETVFKGEVSYLEPSFSTDGHHLTFGGFDFTHRLTRGTTSRTWGGKHTADVDATSVAGEVVSKAEARAGKTSHGLTSAAETAGKAKVHYVAQAEINDYQFLRSLGTFADAAFDPRSNRDDKKVTFKSPEVNANPKATICREKLDPADATLTISADFRLSTVRQVAKVEVRGWDPKTKKVIIGEAKALSSAIDGDPGHEQAGKAHWGSSSAGPTVTIIDMPVRSKDEADMVAKSVFDQYGMDFLTADVVVEGLPGVRAGDVVELKQFGTRFSGKYLVDSATHVVQAGAADPYVTRLHLVRNTAPLPS